MVSDFQGLGRTVGKRYLILRLPNLYTIALGISCVQRYLWLMLLPRGPGVGGLHLFSRFAISMFPGAQGDCNGTRSIQTSGRQQPRWMYQAMNPRSRAWGDEAWEGEGEEVVKSSKLVTVFVLSLPHRPSTTSQRFKQFAPSIRLGSKHEMESLQVPLQTRC